MTTPSSSPPAPASKPVSRRWLWVILVTAFLFVLMPFLFWQSTWFGRPLTDAEIEKNLADREHSRKAQHALSQIADRLGSRDPAIRGSARRWYPQVVALSGSPVDELRLTAAWVMGQDNTAAEFRAALLRLLGDPHPMVRRNAALSLVRFGNSSGRTVILSMLEPYSVLALHSGNFRQRLKPGDAVNPGTLVARIEEGDLKIEVRSLVPGKLARWLAQDGAPVKLGEATALLEPSQEMVWEALRALYLIGEMEDLPAVERFAVAARFGPGAGFRPEILEQARLTTAAIRTRSAR